MRVSQEFLDLSIMILEEDYDIWQETPKVKADMESYFRREYNEEEVRRAIDKIITEVHGNVIEIPDDY